MSRKKAKKELAPVAKGKTPAKKSTNGSAPKSVDDTDAATARKAKAPVSDATGDEVESPDASQLHSVQAGDRYRKQKSWENIVQQVNTVERNEENPETLDIFWIRCDLS